MHGDSISVVIPYFRARKTIATAIRSVLAQTSPPDEVLVVDDGSSDDVNEELNQFGSSVTLIRKPNGGAASARNAGIERAQGEWIAFLDADDYWEPTKLERQLACSADVGLVGGRWFSEYPGKPRRLADVPDITMFGKTFKAHDSEAFDVAMNLWTGVLFVRKSVLGDRRFVPGLEPAEDRDLWIRLAASTSVYLVPEPLATYVQYENSLSNKDPDQDCGNMLRVVRRHEAMLGAEGARKHKAIVYRRWAAGHLARGNPRSAIIPAARRLAVQPVSLQAWWIVSKALAMSVFA